MINRDEIDPQGAIIRQTAEAGVAISEELSNLNPNIEIDAKEFGEHVRNGGWRLGLLVARSVRKGAGQGSRSDISENSEKSSKVSSASFARQAGGSITDKTVTKYLNAWNMAAADGHVSESSTLSPGQGVDFTGTNDNGDLILTPQLWDSYFKPATDSNKNPLVSLHSKVESNQSIDLDVINEANYNCQSDVTVADGYKAACAMERTARSLQEKYLELARQLNIPINDED